MMDINKLCPHCMKEIQGEKGETCPNCGYALSRVWDVKHQLKPFTILQGKYLVGDVLGEGGFGITYIGFDLNLELRIAIKEFYPNGYVTREANVTNELTAYTGQNMEAVYKWRDNFLKEARSLAKCSHLSGVVGVKDFFQENNTAYIVQEYLEGMTLKECMKSTGGRIPVERFLPAIEPVMTALGEVHKQGLIHRDISPDNIMMLKGGQMKLLDFGAARDYTENGEKSLSVLLKPGYAPEEQYRTKGNQGPWSDIYAFAATIYKCITGITPPEAMERMRKDELKRPRELGIVIEPEIEKALLKAMAVFSENRYQTIEEFHSELYKKQTKSAPQFNNVEHKNVEKPSFAVKWKSYGRIFLDALKSRLEKVKKSDKALLIVAVCITIFALLGGLFAIDRNRNEDDARSQINEDENIEQNDSEPVVQDEYIDENIMAMDLYEAFLNNEITAYTESSEKYFLSDFIGDSVRDNKGPVISVEYAYIDCGMDGKQELAVRFIRDIYYQSDVLFFRCENNQMRCFHKIASGYGAFIDLNIYGYLYTHYYYYADDNYDFCYYDADYDYYYEYGPETYSVIDADGMERVIANFDTVSYYGLEYSGSLSGACVGELNKAVANRYGIPFGHELEFTEVTLGDEQQYYTYGVIGIDGSYLGSEIYIDGFYKELFDEAGIPVYTKDAINQMVAEREASLGVTDEIKNADEVTWINLSLNNLYTEDTAIHRYELIISDATWTEAYNDCKRRGGYLVHINTHEEYAVILSQILAENKSNCIFWIGAKRDLSNYEYHWVDVNGNYSNERIDAGDYTTFWISGEPSYVGTNESGEMIDETCVNMFYRKSEDRFVWNDAPDDIITAVSYYAGKIGYICEYED